MAGTILKIKWLTIFMFLGAVFSALITSPMTTNAEKTAPKNINGSTGIPRRNMFNG